MGDRILVLLLAGAGELLLFNKPPHGLLHAPSIHFASVPSLGTLEDELRGRLDARLRAVASPIPADVGPKLFLQRLAPGHIVFAAHVRMTGAQMEELARNGIFDIRGAPPMRLDLASSVASDFLRRTSTIDEATRMAAVMLLKHLQRREVR